MVERRINNCTYSCPCDSDDSYVFHFQDMVKPHRRMDKWFARLQLEQSMIDLRQLAEDEARQRYNMQLGTCPFSKEV